MADALSDLVDMLDFPRHVHNAALESKIIGRDELDAALAEGWTLKPTPIAVVKGDQRHLVGTADELAYAKAQGWTVVASEPASEPTSEPAVRAKRSKKDA